MGRSEGVIMVSSELRLEVRPITLEDLDVIFSIDRKIRGMGKAITYARRAQGRTDSIFWSKEWSPSF